MSDKFYIDRNIDGHPIRFKEETNDGTMDKKSIVAALNFLDSELDLTRRALSLSNNRYQELKESVKSLINSLTNP